MDTEKEDRRLLQSALTRETIKDTFLKLLSTMSFSKIRVTNICSEAHITRTTFYYHYCDIFKAVNQKLCWADGDDYYKIQMVLLRFILGGYKALFSHNSSSNNVSIGKLLHTSSLTAFDTAKDDSSPKKIKKKQ